MSSQSLKITQEEHPMSSKVIEVQFDNKIDTNGKRSIRQPPRSCLRKITREDDCGHGKDQHYRTIIKPVIFVEKKDGSFRFCVNYCKLNDITKKDNYPLPSINEIPDIHSGIKWFTTWDKLQKVATGRCKQINRFKRRLLSQQAKVFGHSM